MANLVLSIVNKFEGLTAAGFPSSTVPPVYHDEAVAVRNAAQLRVPYVTFTTTPNQVDLTFESAVVEGTKLTFSVFYRDEGDLTRAVNAIRFNNQNLENNAGFDNGTLPTLTEGSLLSMLLTEPPAQAFDGMDYEGKFVYRADFAYDIEVERS